MSSYSPVPTLKIAAVLVGEQLVDMVVVPEFHTLLGVQELVQCWVYRNK